MNGLDFGGCRFKVKAATTSDVKNFGNISPERLEGF